ncbi:MAG TPA: DNA translocase FtsK [Tepidisphaeraceae bacterium]|nr:DNA translocase FtsK [Tepidisphaeraceae bacterium]
MERNYVLRQTALFLALAAWAFLLLALGSFSPTDWPSHTVFPWPPMQNLCGSAGAFVAYYCFLAIGQGVFPVLFFSGVLLALVLFKNRVSDVWLRVIGLLLLSTAFAAAVHHLKPGSMNGFPEGHGGLLGITASTFLQSHFSVWGTRLILLTGILIGMLLAADDLVLRTPGVAMATVQHVREMAPNLNLPKFNFNFPSLPKLPSLPNFKTRESMAMLRPPRGKIGAARGRSGADIDDLDDDEMLPPELPKRQAKPQAVGADKMRSNGEKVAPLPVAGRPSKQVVPTPEIDPNADIELSYDHDEPVPAAIEAAFVDGEHDSPPSEEAFIPPVEEQAVPKPPEVKRDIIVKLPNMMKPRQVAPPPPPQELGEYQLPGWDVLEEAEHGYAESQEAFVREQAVLLEQALKEFAIEANVVEIDTGPVITMYELALAPGIKVSTISGLSNDIQRALKAETVRIVAPIPGKSTVGIEVPNAQKEKVRFKDLMQLAPPEVLAKSDIPLFLGKDASGEPLITSLEKMPHCLIAGTTGSGKSVCINTIIMSILYKQRPDMVKLVLFDPKVVEMAMYKDIPHLMCPVINDAAKATSVLEWACQKMDERYEFLAEAGVRNIKGYNSLTQEELIERFQPSTPEEEAKIPKKLPYIVIIIDELADLMMTSGKEVESHIVRIAQKARAVGIHLILATQRPSANVVTGLIKSNMPTRIAFRVQSKMDSRIVLDQNGADLLLGHGDMLFLPPGASKPTRAQGTFIDDKEVRDSVKAVRAMAEAQYEPELVQIKASGTVDEEAAKDDLFDDAVRVVLETKRGSVSLLQRRLTIGYSRASRLIEAMAAAGIVGSYKGSQAREAQITIEEWEAMKAQMQQDSEDGMSV